MKKYFKIFGLALATFAVCAFGFVGCGNGNNCDNKSLTLASYENTEKNYTVSNSGVSLSCTGDNKYELSGEVAIAPEALISDFNFQENEKHIVSLKLTADKEVEKDNFSLEVKGPTKTNTYDKSALDGDDYTYLLLSVDGMTDEKCYEITVKWNKDDQGTTYTICKGSSLTLAQA